MADGLVHCLEKVGWYPTIYIYIYINWYHPASLLHQMKCAKLENLGGANWKILPRSTNFHLTVTNILEPRNSFGAIFPTVKTNIFALGTLVEKMIALELRLDQSRTYREAPDYNMYCAYIFVCVCIYIYICVCVREREREWRGNFRFNSYFMPLIRSLQSQLFITSPPPRAFEFLNELCNCKGKIMEIFIILCNYQVQFKRDSCLLIPIHIWIKRNEKADSSAKLSLNITPDKVNIPHGDLKSKYAKFLCTKRQQRWNNKIYNIFFLMKIHTQRMKTSIVLV